MSMSKDVSYTPIHTATATRYAVPMLILTLVRLCGGSVPRLEPAQRHQSSARGTWRQFVSALRNFLSKRSDADSTFYFLSTFLAGEERAEDRAPRRSAFSEFMRALDAHFAPASTSETAELLLERAKSFVLTPSRTLSALLEERLRAVELAGRHSQIGLYEYVRGTFSELVEGLPTCRRRTLLDCRICCVKLKSTSTRTTSLRAGQPGLDVPDCCRVSERWVLGRAWHRAAIGGREGW
eukprot:scaffold3189_cov138-Isochrysis_galbana.AAC.3